MLQDQSIESYDCRSEIGCVPLPATGDVRSLKGPRHLQANIREIVEESYLRFCEMKQRTRSEFPTGIDAREVRLAWDRWMNSHFAFIYELGLLAEEYRQVIASFSHGNATTAFIHAMQAKKLWIGMGALMRYGVDFQPKSAIYQQCIRKQMPAGFSGEWIREWSLLHSRLGDWHRTGRKHGETLWGEIQDLLHSGESRYHHHHGTVMTECVPGEHSLKRKYEIESARQLQITEEHFNTYDNWFHLDRSGDLDMATYVRSACRIFETVLADMSAEGTCLEAEVTQEIKDGICAALLLMWKWLPQNETSESCRYCGRKSEEVVL